MSTACVCAQVPKPLSFGSAMLGAPAADHWCAPSQLVPDAWLLCFTKHHADAAVWSGLFRTCRGGRDLALRAARQAALTLPCFDQEPDAGWERQLATVRDALSVRGARPTRLRLPGLQTDGEDQINFHTGRTCDAWARRLALMPGRLVGVGQGITKLDLSLWGEWEYGVFLTQLAWACPNVTSLQLKLPYTLKPNFTSPQPPPIPPRSLWPKLTSLRVPQGSVDTDWLVQHVAPYMGQLTTLQLPSCPYYQTVQWPALFPQYPTTTNTPLTHFTANAQLTDGLLSELLAHAPGLESLSVREVAVQSVAFRDRVWGLKEIGMCGCYQRVSLESLTLLPKSRCGSLRVTQGVIISKILGQVSI